MFKDGGRMNDLATLIFQSTLVILAFIGLRTSKSYRVMWLTMTIIYLLFTGITFFEIKY